MTHPPTDGKGVGPTIRAQDRVLAIGQTGSGKSVWMQAHVAQRRCRIFIYDVKGDINWRGPPGDVVTVRKAEDAVRELKRGKIRVVRYIPDDDTDQKANQIVFAQLLDMQNVAIWVDEAIGATGPNTICPALRGIYTRGRSRALSVYAGAQMPVGFNPLLRDQAQHIIIFANRYSIRNLQYLSTFLGYDSPRQLRARLMQLADQYGALGKYAHLHFEPAEGKIWARPPLPAWMRKL